nr:MAG TPA: hypothetical protein [Caudoviricetes sp.]
MGEFISSINENTLSKIGEIGRGFIERTADIYRRSGFDELVNLRDRMRRNKQRAVRDFDDIQAYASLDDFVMATPRMRRWIIANPSLRKRYRRKELSGWDNEVQDDLQFTPEEHPDYQYVTNGMLIDDKYTEYVNVFVENIRDTEELSFSERTDVVLTWDTAEKLIEQRYDPTSKWGAMLE